MTDLGLVGRKIVCAEQIHGNGVALACTAAMASLPDRNGFPYFPQVDALITADRNLALLLFFADCCPVWLYCPDPLCGAVAHCGWRGTVADLPAMVVAALGETFAAPPDRLHAVVGPSICATCYEVGPEVVDAVCDLGLMQAVTERTGSLYLDLIALNIALLERAGLPADHIQAVNSCTRCGAIPLYSWRRDGPATGRLGAFLGLV